MGLGVVFGRRPPSVVCILVTMRPQLLAQCLDRFRNDRYQFKELVVVLHGNEMSLKDARALVKPGERISIYKFGKEVSLGSCLNFAAAQSDAEYWAKIDDDDLYGPDYLSDIFLHHRAVDFPIGGKTAAFTYSEASDEILWDERHSATRSRQLRRGGSDERVHIAGGTLVGKRSILLNELPFSEARRRGSDSDLVRRYNSAGYPFVSFDYFNFALYRSDRPGFHTWDADMRELARRARAVGSGADIENMVFI
nr:glycosyltransferase [Lysobacter sp. GX 14042]